MNTDEISELEDLQPSRLDGVGLPANGFPILMLKSQEDEYSEFVKSKYSAKQLRSLKAKGQTFPGTTSYPIADAEDLSNAIHAVGRGKVAGHDAIRAYIIKRAKAMGKESEIPENWGADGSLKKADEYGKKPTDDEGDSDQDEKIKGKDTSGKGSGDGTGTHNSEVEKGEEPATDKAVDAVIEKLKGVVSELIDAQKKDVKYASKADANSSSPDGTGDQVDDLSEEDAKSNEEKVQHAEKAGKRISSATESEIRAAIQALEDLLDSGNSASKGKDIRKMTEDELNALVAKGVDEALTRHETALAQTKADKKTAKKGAVKKAQKQAKANAKKAKKETKDESKEAVKGEDMSKSSEGLKLTPEVEEAI
ncbi:MAG: hypothetical protein KGI08_11170, partial [Thaumarchaeota archaeon]|nr:hypothetical protein [Nitrososphaerota archaeon]